MTFEVSGRELVDLIRRRWELEWWGCSPRKTKKIDAAGRVSPAEHASLRPPHTTFRFKDEHPSVIAALLEAVSSYDGAVKWVMFSHDRAPLPGTNWVIMPSRAAAEVDLAHSKGMTVGQLFESDFPEFGPACFQDLPGLVDHIRRHVDLTKFAARVRDDRES
jgi:hypothetical protein